MKTKQLTHIFFSIFTLITLLLSAFQAKPVYAAGGEWEITGSLKAARMQHTATLLSNGKVLVVGGWKDFALWPLDSVESFDPTTGIWTKIGATPTAHANHTATVLDNGKVLIVGGWYSKSAELYDPTTGTWSAAGSLHENREDHIAILLSNGKVLVVGGMNANGILTTTELYDPSTNKWTVTNGPNISETTYTATLLRNGKVLVAGGQTSTICCLASAELYDPATNTWTPTGSLKTPRYGHTATLLSNGKVLVVGGANTIDARLASAELYDPATGKWSNTGILNEARLDHTATILPNGKVLVVGGAGDSYPTLKTEVYDPVSGKWTMFGPLNTSREFHTITLLSTGNVLVSGGFNWDSFTSITSSEIYHPLFNKNFLSTSDNDGWVLEFTESSNIGGILNSTSTTLYIGDDQQNKQYKGILSFNTASLPDNAIITKVTLKLKIQGVVGGDPFNTHGSLLIDIRKGSFGNTVLEKTDFQASSSKNSIGSIPRIPNNGWYIKAWTSNIFDYVNKTGITQLRLRFRLDDDGDATADYLKFYSGNSPNANTRPIFIIEYYFSFR